MEQEPYQSLLAHHLGRLVMREVMHLKIEPYALLEDLSWGLLRRILVILAQEADDAAALLQISALLQAHGLPVLRLTTTALSPGQTE